MKKLFILFALILCAASFAVAQKSSMMAKETTEQALMRMENEIAAGLVKGDTKAFDMYISDKAVLVDPMGMKGSKADVIALFKNGTYKFTQMTPEAMTVTMFGTDTAVVSFISNDKGIVAGQAVDGKTRWTDTFMKMNGKWWCIATAGVAVMEMK
jgi:alkyl sulfatase BDS1-like metallo-beta-lactamase superfamily hydrolase